MFSILFAVLALGQTGASAYAVVPAPVTIVQKHQHTSDEVQKLGRTKIGDFTVSAVLIGEAEAGAKVKLDIKLIDAKLDPKSIRVWIGNEDTSEDSKVKLTKGETTYVGEFAVPKPIPVGAKVWVELEVDSGTSRGSFAMDTHGHKH